jgi:hypothetical protein
MEVAHMDPSIRVFRQSRDYLYGWNWEHVPSGKRGHGYRTRRAATEAAERWMTEHGDPEGRRQMALPWKRAAKALGERHRAALEESEKSRRDFADLARRRLDRIVTLRSTLTVARVDLRCHLDGTSPYPACECVGCRTARRIDALLEKSITEE